MKKKVISLIVLSLFCTSVFYGCNISKKSNDVNEKNTTDYNLKKGEYKIIKKSDGETVLVAGNTETSPNHLLYDTFEGFEQEEQGQDDVFAILNTKQFQEFNEKLETYIKGNYEILLKNLNEDERKKFLEENICKYQFKLTNNIKIESYNIINDNTISFDLSIACTTVNRSEVSKGVSTYMNGYLERHPGIPDSEKKVEILNNIAQSDYGLHNDKKITITFKATDGKWSMNSEDMDKILNALSSLENNEEICSEIIKLIS